MSIEDIERRCNEASPRPWIFRWWERQDVPGTVSKVLINGKTIREADAEFIAHAREDVPKLLEVAKAARDALPLVSGPNKYDRLREALEKL